MKPGDLVQAQKHFWADEIGSYISLKTHAAKISVSPGDLLLLTSILQGKEQFPIYNYFTINFYAGGRHWSTTATIENAKEINDYVQLFESPTLMPRR